MIDFATKTERRILTPEEIKVRAPAVYGTRPAPHHSDRYELIRTDEMLNAFMERGFVVTDAKQDNPTRRNPMHVRHALELMPESLFTNPDIDTGMIPRITLINSHNGRTKARFIAGLFRLICTNGLMAGTPDATYEVRHLGAIEAQIEAALKGIIDSQSRMMHAAETWDAIELTKGKVHDFGLAAAQLRFGEERAKGYDLDIITSTQRAEDEGRSLWKVFNRVQENLSMGQIEGINANGRRVRSRALTGIAADVEFNKGLWNIADNFAQVA